LTAPGGRPLFCIIWGAPVGVAPGGGATAGVPFMVGGRGAPFLCGYGGGPPRGRPPVLAPQSVFMLYCMLYYVCERTCAGVNALA